MRQVVRMTSSSVHEVGPSWTEPGVYEVAPGVFRIPLPLEEDHLKAVNVYALVDGGTATLVDSGWVAGASRERLTEGLRALDLGPADITRVLVTHLHRDHYTLGVALRREFGFRIELGAGERRALELAAGDGNRPFAAQRTQMVRCGATELVDWLDAVGGTDSRHDPRDWEQPDHWLEPQATVSVGDRVLEGLPTPGHTRGHFVFDDAASGLLFTGDHVLPHITPSIGFEPDLAASPLADFLASLAFLKARPDRTMLPAHGPAGGSVHGRVDQLLEHHRDRLDTIAGIVERADGPVCPFDVARQMVWTRRNHPLDALDPFNRILAASEVESHLEVLVSRSVLDRTDAAGVRRYAPTGA